MKVEVGATVKGPKCKNTVNGAACGGTQYLVIRSMAYPIIRAECTACGTEDYIAPVSN